MKCGCEEEKLIEDVVSNIMLWETKCEILVLKNKEGKYATFQLLGVGDKEFVEKRDNIEITI